MRIGGMRIQVNQSKYMLYDAGDAEIPRKSKTEPKLAASFGMPVNGSHQWRHWHRYASISPFTERGTQGIV
jgi:hypothetical protein